MSTQNLCFEQKNENKTKQNNNKKKTKTKKKQFLYLKFFQFLEMTFSIYLNRRVFVMEIIHIHMALQKYFSYSHLDFRGKM